MKTIRLPWHCRVFYQNSALHCVRGGARISQKGDTPASVEKFFRNRRKNFEFPSFEDKLLLEAMVHPNRYENLRKLAEWHETRWRQI